MKNMIITKKEGVFGFEEAILLIKEIQQKHPELIVEVATEETIKRIIK